MSAPTIDLLSLERAHANGSLVSAAADEERPHATLPSCPSATCVTSISRTRGGIIRSLRPAMVRIAAEDNALAFPQPSALQIEDVLGARSGRDGAKENQSKE